MHMCSNLADAIAADERMQGSAKLAPCAAQVLEYVDQLFGSDPANWSEGSSIFQGPVMGLEVEKLPFEKAWLPSKVPAQGDALL